MYILDERNLSKLNDTTFAELNLKESDVEDILRKNVDVLCDDEESMLIVGQQVVNEKLGRCDLTAINSDGDIVLIEIKRDKKDIEIRKEAFEFQAIRYAASMATIKSTDSLIQDVYAPYVEKHKEEFKDKDSLTSSEIAKRQLSEFATSNNIKSFNEHQRIILVASEFDEQTLSAVAWLNSNEVDISCFQLCLYKNNDSIFIDVKKILPIHEYDDFYVNLMTSNSIMKNESKTIIRHSYPKIDSMIKWGVVKAGDIIVAKNTKEESILQSNGQVKNSSGKTMTIQQWLKSIYGWNSVATYLFAVHKETGKTLSDIRREYMESNNIGY